MRNTFWILIFIFISSCGPKVIYEHKMEITDKKWLKNKGEEFSFVIDNDQQAYDLILEVTYNENFSYQNLYVKIKTTFPDQKSTEDIVSLELSDRTGKSNGKCSGDICESPIQMKSNIKFRQKGKYSILLNQYSREEVVEGIHSLKLKIMEVEKGVE